MSLSREAGFAFVRKAEVEALMRCRPRAAMAFIYIRAVLARREDEPFLCGSRDFKPCGLGRDAAAGALGELERERLIECVDRGSFTRGKKATWRIVHTKAAVQNTAGLSANSNSDTAGKSANTGRKTRQLCENTAGLSDTPKDTPAPAEQERGAGVSSPAFAAAEAAAAKREEDLRKRQKALLLRVERCARALGMSDVAFTMAAGGPSAADILARKWERGQYTELSLRAVIAERQQGFERNGEGESDSATCDATGPAASPRRG